MANRKRHVYAGEDDAVRVCRWLNEKNRPADDPVEKLIKLHSEIGTPGRDVPEEIRTLVSQLVVDYELAVAPTVGEVSRERWDVSWRPAWLPGVKLTPDQGLALVKVIQLAERGLLAQIQRCKECQKYFFVRFEHQEFCSDPDTDCQQRYAHRQPEWKAKRAKWARDHRKTLKDKAAAQARRKWTQKDDERLGKRHSRFAKHIKTKRWHG